MAENTGTGQHWVTQVAKGKDHSYVLDKLLSIFLGIIAPVSKGEKYTKCKKHLHHAPAFCPYSSVIRSLFTW